MTSNETVNVLVSCFILPAPCIVMYNIIIITVIIIIIIIIIIMYVYLLLLLLLCMCIYWCIM